jgi:hypothetical protein
MGNIKPKITEDKIEKIQRLIRDNPEWHRTRISKQLCELWDWRSPNGQLKDISCRDMLRALDESGKIILPMAKNRSRRAGNPDAITQIQHDTTPITAGLRELTPLRIDIVTSKESMSAFKSYIDQYHYLGFDRSIGENMKYIIYSRTGEPLTCLLFGSSAWACLPRDEYIGWDKDCRQNNLYLTTNNTRFLIFPWVSVPHLASHVLSLISRRIADDWLKKYGHAVYLLETYVERERFRGTCYRAANWRFVGCTTGRGRNSEHNYAVLPIKDVYLYPLAADFRAKLSRSAVIG